MATLPWTFEVAPPGVDAAGLEEYVVETADGSEVGRVHVVLERDAELYVAVDEGRSPATRELIAVPAAEVDSADHAALRLRLRVRSADDLAVLPRLDRARAIERREGQEARVDARRVTAESPRIAGTGRLAR